VNTLLTTQLIQSFEELLNLKNEWNGLLVKSETNTIFLTFEWITNWWKYFGQDKELFVLLVKDNEEIMGIAPLMISNSKKIQFIGNPLADYCDFIIANEKELVLKTIYEYLSKNKSLWDNINLEEIPEYSSTLTFSKNILQSNGIKFNIFFTNKCFSINFKDENTEIIKKILKKKDLRRHISFLRSHGNLSVDKIKTVEEALILLNTLFEQHIKIWDKKEIPSLFNYVESKDFFINLTKELLPQGKIDILVLRLNQKPIAIQFGFNHNNKYITFIQSYDLYYYKNSPGTILYKLFINKYYQERFNEVDFSRGSEVYKNRFANKSMNNYGIAIYKNAINSITNKFYNRSREKIMNNHKFHSFVHKYKNKVLSIIYQ